MSLLGIAHEAVARYGAMQKPTELAALLAIVQGQQPRVIYEIGTATGGTLWALAYVASYAMLVSIDLPEGPFSGGATIDEDALERLIAEGKMHRQLFHIIRGDSRTVALPDLVPELVLIDGDHSYEGVKADWDRYAPLVAEGGVVVFHDILPHPDNTGVHVELLWREIAAEFDTVEIVTPDPGKRQWGGIGVVYL